MYIPQYKMTHTIHRTEWGKRVMREDLGLLHLRYLAKKRLGDRRHPRKKIEKLTRFAKQHDREISRIKIPQR